MSDDFEFGSDICMMMSDALRFSSVWLGNKSEWRKLISAQYINSELNVVKILNNLCHSYLFPSQDFNQVKTCLPIIAVRLRQLKPIFYFAAPCSSSDIIKNNISGSFLYNTLVLHYNIRASSPGLGYILIYVRGESVGQSYSSVGHRFTRVGQTINLSFT
jgi:hypothetical protein